LRLKKISKIESILGRINQIVSDKKLEELAFDVQVRASKKSSIDHDDYQAVDLQKRRSIVGVKRLLQPNNRTSS